MAEAYISKVWVRRRCSLVGLCEYDSGPAGIC